MRSPRSSSKRGTGSLATLALGLSTDDRGEVLLAGQPLPRLAVTDAAVAQLGAEALQASDRQAEG